MERKGLKTLGALKNYILIYSFKLNKLSNFLVFCLIRDQYDGFFLSNRHIYLYKVGDLWRIPFLHTEAIKVKETAVMSHTLRQLCSSMDIPLVIAKKLYSGKKIPTFFLFRMWIGYGFDAAEIAAVMVNPGFVYSNTTWMYVFYFYLAFVVIIGFILTVSFKLSEEISDNKLHSCFAFFKLTSAVTAGVIFFQLYLQDDRDPLTIFIMVVTGADMSLDFVEMAAGCASLGFNMVYPLEMNKEQA